MCVRCVVGPFAGAEVTPWASLIVSGLAEFLLQPVEEGVMGSQMERPPDQTQVRTETESKSAGATRKAAKDDSGKPPPDKTFWSVGQELSRTARETRNASYRSIISLVVLTVVAAGAVIAGVIAHSEGFWSGAGTIFYLALAAVVAYAANHLGIALRRPSFSAEH
jgi:hypothetical protein